MKMKQLKNDMFIKSTAIYSIAISVLYFCQGLVEGFSTSLFLYIGINIVFIPITLIIRKNICIPYLLLYSIILLYLIAFTPTYFYNNFSSFFLICIISILCPKIKLASFICYFIVITTCFIFGTEKIYHYLIHITRCLYFYVLLSFITKQINSVKLELNKDEIIILKQLALGMQQKEIKEISKNTVTKKLRAARERNNLTSNYELIVKYKNSYK